MKTMRMLIVLFAAMLMMVPRARAQEKSKPAGEAKPVIPLKVQVMLSEYEGEKKISSLPYTIFVNADNPGGRSTSLRMGLRIPIQVGTKDFASSIQYVDVGTNIDCSASAAEDGRFKLALAIERSSVYAVGTEKKTQEWSPGDARLTTSPILRQFRLHSDLLIRDGQMLQGGTATDPISGQVLKMDITVSVLK
jgi:hypothetical protein